MKKVSIFLDSSALIAGVISENGAAHVLLQLGETEDVSLKISEFVFNETTRSIGRKSPENLENVQRERSRRQELSFFKTRHMKRFKPICI